MSTFNLHNLTAIVPFYATSRNPYPVNLGTKELEDTMKGYARSVESATLEDLPGIAKDMGWEDYSKADEYTEFSDSVQEMYERTVQSICEALELLREGAGEENEGQDLIDAAIGELENILPSRIVGKHNCQGIHGKFYTNKQFELIERLGLTGVALHYDTYSGSRGAHVMVGEGDGDARVWYDGEILKVKGSHGEISLGKNLSLRCHRGVTVNYDLKLIDATFGDWLSPTPEERGLFKMLYQEGFDICHILDGINKNRK